VKIKKLILIRHCSGAGSSTLAKFLSTYLDFGIDAGGKVCHYEADQWMMDADGNYKFDAVKLGYCHAQCRHSTAKAMLNEVPAIIVSNTFSRESEIAPYIELAEINDYEVTVMILENRHGNKSVHNVPEETLQRQETNIKNSLKLR